jgi:hypothetical protein
MKKAKTAKVMECHGKVETTQPTRLEQIWGGFNEMARYGTTDEGVYSAEVTEMNRSDLEAHARKVGVVIVEDSARLRDKLISEFRNYITYLNKPATVAKKPEAPSEAVRKILAEGR